MKLTKAEALAQGWVEGTIPLQVLMKAGPDGHIDIAYPCDGCTQVMTGYAYVSDPPHHDDTQPAPDGVDLHCRKCHTGDRIRAHGVDLETLLRGRVTVLLGGVHQVLTRAIAVALGWLAKV